MTGVAVFLLPHLSLLTLHPHTIKNVNQPQTALSYNWLTPYGLHFCGLNFVLSRKVKLDPLI